MRSPFDRSRSAVAAAAYLVLIGAGPLVHADQEGGPSFYVTASGTLYAKCIPSDSRPNQDREKGKTLIYRAGVDKDVLEYTFDWYSPQLYIAWANGHTFIRMGPWPRGHLAKEEDLALAFYHEDKLVQRYSTLDLAGTPENVSRSVSHYDVIKEVTGVVDIFVRSGRNVLTNKPERGFEVVLEHDRKLVFDLETGQRINLTDEMFTRRNTQP